MSAPALVVLPTFNEKENLEAVVAAVRAQGHAVLVVDDNSPDGTGAIADRLAAADPAIAVLHRPGKLGLGSAYVQGFRWGLEREHDLFCEMDADGSHLAVHLPALIAAAQECGGLAVGSRWIPGGSVHGWGPARFALSRGANFYTRAILGIAVRDATSGYRCYTRALLERIDLERVLSQGYSFQIEMVYRTLRLGFKVAEVPIRFEDRVRGASKVSRSEVTRALAAVIKLRFGKQVG